MSDEKEVHLGQGPNRGQGPGMAHGQGPSLGGKGMGPRTAGQGPKGPTNQQVSPKPPAAPSDKK